MFDVHIQLIHAHEYGVESGCMDDGTHKCIILIGVLLGFERTERREI